MDTNSSYDSYGLIEKKDKVIKKSFYTEMIKEKDDSTVIIRIKKKFKKWLS